MQYKLSISNSGDRVLLSDMSPSDQVYISVFVECNEKGLTWLLDFVTKMSQGASYFIGDVEFSPGRVSQMLGDAINIAKH